VKYAGGRHSSVLAAYEGKSCEFCQSTETPMWRKGPSGKNTLCNKCGVKWSTDNRKALEAGGAVPSGRTASSNGTNKRPNPTFSQPPRSLSSAATAPETGPITFEQKVQLSNMIETLSERHQASVIEMIRSSVTMIGSSQDEEEIELDIDAIDPVSLRRLFDHVVSCVEQDKKVAAEKQKAARRMVEEFKRNRGEMVDDDDGSESD